jgi:hypothetical protein
MWPFSKKKSASQPPLPAGAGHQPVLRALSPWIERHRRRAWKPILGEDDTGAATPRASHFGGAPSLRAGEDAPRCALCDQPIDLLLELDGRETPAGSPWTGPLILQVFYCCACEEFEPFSEAHLVRAVRADELASPATGAAEAAEYLPHRAITAWEPFDDSPHPEEQDRLGLHLDYDFKAGRVAVRCPELALNMPNLDLEARDADGNELAEAIGMAAPGDKLGGWPGWIQGVEYPSCPRCATSMQCVFQIDSECGVDHMFGDMGCGHVSRCPNHPEVLAFTWACS